MPYGRSCRQVAFSSRQGTDVHNDQCGGATAVKFELPEESQFGECTMDIHSINFDCSAGEKHPGHHVSSWSESQPEPTTSVSTHPASVHEHHSTYISTTTTCTTDTTEISAGHPSLTTASPSAITTSVVTTHAPCPELVPKCLNTWLSIPKCDSNSDTACFCPSSEFTDKVQSCIYAWGSSQQEVDSALSYFAGICAPYVPENPAIVDVVPTPSPTPAATHSEYQLVETPCTTLTWSSHTVTVPQVGFNTVTCSSTTSVDLILGTPVSAPTSSPSEASHSHPWSSTMTTPCSTPVSAPISSPSEVSHSHTWSSSTTTSPCSTHTKAGHTHTRSSSTTTRPCSTHTSTSFTTVTHKPTRTRCTTTKSTSEPTETLIHANAGMKPVVGGLWAVGVAVFVLALN